jgi:hypothetical protein
LVLTILPVRERKRREHPERAVWIELVKDIRALLKIQTALT